MKHLFTIAAVVLATAEIFAQIPPKILGVTLSGACNPNTSQATVTDDGQYLSVLFDDLKSEIGTGSSRPQHNEYRAVCTMDVALDVPIGTQYALDTTEFKGFANVPTSGQAMHTFSVLMPGPGQLPSLRQAILRGPYQNNYEQSVKPKRPNWSTCGSTRQTVRIVADLLTVRLRNAVNKDLVQLSLDSTDTGGLQSRFKLLLQACR